MLFFIDSLGVTYKHQTRNHLASNISKIYYSKILKIKHVLKFNQNGLKKRSINRTHAWFYFHTILHLNNPSKNIIIHNIFQLRSVILLSWLYCVRAFVKTPNLRNVHFFMMEIGVILTLIEHQKFHESLTNKNYSWLGFDVSQSFGKFSGRDGKRN